MEVEIHPWSQGFKWVDHIGPFTFLSKEQVQEFDRDGFFVIPELFTQPEIDAVRSEIDPMDEQYAAWLAGNGDNGMNENGAISLLPNLVGRSPFLRRFVHHPSLLGLAADLLGPDVDLYLDQAVCKRPERPRVFPLHQDTGYQLTEPEDFVSVWIALSEAVPENGCLYLAPGLHRSGTLRHQHVEPQGWEECLTAQDPDLVAAPLRPGGAVVFSSLTPHKTAANTTRSIRRGYLILYSRPGTVAYEGRQDGPKPVPKLQGDTHTQFPVLRDGRPVS
jgi:phytanoyl-CoA hydroxylase